MKYGLVTPYTVHEKHNAGWHMITKGIKHLIRCADPEAKFIYISMFVWPKNVDFDNAGLDWFILCGNPRYDNNKESGQWLYEGLLKQMKSYDIPILDAWQGTGGSLGLTDEQVIAEVSETERTLNIVSLLNGSKVITRDRLSQAINDKWYLDSVYLPCSSFWAKDEYGIESNPDKTEKIFVIYRMGGYSDAKSLVRTMARTHRILATSVFDSDWCEEIGVKHELRFDPEELLNIYAKSIEVISFRLHAAIPAASLGAKVYMLAIDTRGTACEIFGIPYDDYRNGVGESKTVDFDKIKKPNLESILSK